MLSDKFVSISVSRVFALAGVRLAGGRVPVRVPIVRLEPRPPDVVIRILGAQSSWRLLGGCSGLGLIMGGLRRQLETGPHLASFPDCAPLASWPLLNVRSLWFAALLASGHTSLGPHRLGPAAGTSAECVGGEVVRGVWPLVLLVVEAGVPAGVDILVTHAVWASHCPVAGAVASVHWVHQARSTLGVSS